MNSVPFDFPRMRELLDRLGIRPSRHKDQHFLHNPAHVREIAELAALTPQHRVVEVGSGPANLTVELARRAGSVLSVEMDPAFEEWHAEVAAHFPNLQFQRGDFLKFDVEASLATLPPGPTVAAGNLPYQITAPVLFKLINSAVAWERIVAMVQLEVAERIAAGVQTRRASALTYKIALEYDARIAMRLGPREFFPPPRVHSAVVVLEPRAQRLLRDAAHKERLHALISAVFTHRRRTLANAMTLGGATTSREQAEARIHTADLDPKQRPETLSLEDFLRLDDAAGEDAR